MLVCPHCGQPTAEGRYCGACGQSLTAAPVTAPAPTFAPAAAPAAPPARPVGVTVLAVLAFLGAAGVSFAALAALVFSAFSSAIVSESGWFFFPFAFLGMFAIFFAVLLAGLAALLAFTGAGLLNGQAWARVAAMVLAVFYGLGGLGDIGRMRSGGIIAVLIAGGIMYYLFRPEVKEYFERRA